MGLSGERGSIQAGLAADLALMAPDRRVVETWIAGEAETV
jgi:N-acetylglucosamine-6-phosphate deacetylase